jgi:hypothetical protein
MGQWDKLGSNSVKRGLRMGMNDDDRLSHEESVDMLWETLRNGTLSMTEVNDLDVVATQSRSISPWSRAMLNTFVSQAREAIAHHGPYRLYTLKQQFAAEMVCNFLKRPSRKHFPNLNQNEIGAGLLMRIAHPGILDQGAASLCGPTALMHSVASDRPGEYARFAIDLYEYGKAKLGRLMIEPGKDARNYSPNGKIPPVDWLTMASIRDSENAFFDYDDADKEFAGITLPGELANWFRRAGYSDVKNVTNVVFNKGGGTLDEADRLYAAGYRVCLFIGINMLSGRDQTSGSTTAEHWVVLRSPITRTGENVRLTVFTWGSGNHEVPQSGTLSLENFYRNFYGFVAAKP